MEQSGGRPGALPDVLAAAAAIAALAAAVAVRRLGLDTGLFLAVNGWRALPDVLWETLGVAGLGLAAFVVLSVGAHGHPRVIAALPWMLLVGGGLTQVVKWALPMARPAALVAAAQLHVVGPKLFQRSMPSGHTMTAVAATGILWLAARGRWRRWWALAAAVALAAAIGLSRVVSGAHWPADVFAGAAMGWATARVSVHLADVTRTGALLATGAGRAVVAAAQVGAGIACATDLGYQRTLAIQWVLAAAAVIGGVRGFAELHQARRRVARRAVEVRT